MQIDLLRHGEYEGEKAYCGVSNRKLSERGWQQMRDACNIPNNWELIVSSPLSRCATFARHLSETLGLQLQIDERWQEMNFGMWDGRTALDIMQDDEQGLTDFWNNPLQHSPPDGETLQQVNARVLQAWEELKQQSIPLLVVTHGGPMSIIHCHQENHPLSRLMEIQVQYAEMRSYSINKDETQ